MSLKVPFSSAITRPRIRISAYLSTLDQPQGNITDQVSIDVAVDDFAPDAFCVFARPRDGEKFKVRNRVSHGLWRRPQGQMCRDRREDVSPVESAADRMEPVFGVGQMKGPHRRWQLHVPGYLCGVGQIVLEHPAQEAVVGCDKGTVGRLKNDGPTGGADSRVNHRHMDCAGWKVPVADAKGKCALRDILRRDLVGQVNHVQVWINAQRNALEHPGVGVGQPKVGGEYKERAAHRASGRDGQNFDNRVRRLTFLNGQRRTTMIERTIKTAERIMVNWKSVFSAPRRVRTVDWAEPKRPPLPSLTCARMVSTNTADTSSCTMRIIVSI